MSACFALWLGTCTVTGPSMSPPAGSLGIATETSTYRVLLGPEPERFTVVPTLLTVPATVDASAIAGDSGLGTRALPIVNTALLGAAAEILGLSLADAEAEMGDFTAGDVHLAPYFDARYSLLHGVLDRADAGVRVRYGDHVVEPSNAAYVL